MDLPVYAFALMFQAVIFVCTKYLLHGNDELNDLLNVYQINRPPFSKV